MVHELAVRVQQLERVPAAERRVAGVEAEAEQRSIEPLDEPLDLARRLDVCAGVVVERGRKAALAAVLGGAMRALLQQREPLVVEPGLGVLLDAPGDTRGARARRRRPR